MIRMTATEAANGENQPFANAIFVDSLKSVIGTAWIKTTGRYLERGDDAAIKSNRYQK
jgi:hypothetical protein